MTRLAAPGGRLRRVATDPLVPVLVLAAAGAATVAGGAGVGAGGAAGWAVLGALAGYTLSGSV